ncbi:hypothetical protein CO046_05440 [Candidatus Peregrinibacteria bacterium CG_4_9_14_0_2_um_filter_53_11]|nr:MAG: hypothetical protein CO046_05440 [Candidatus Peregrinibacteria bacterium CG_4_9_14_0_2_um_filter_53_11]
MKPILFEIGFLTVYSLWFFVTLSFVAGVFLFTHFSKKNRLRIDLITDNALSLFLVSLITARLFFIALNWQNYFYEFSVDSSLKLFEIWDKGLSFWGGLVGFAAVLVWKARGAREQLLSLADHLAPPLMLAISITSFGAFLDGANYGVPTELPWGVAFRSANVKYISEIHPTQLYGLVYSGALALLGFWLLKKLRGKSMLGLISELTLTGYGLLRFLEEFVRGDDLLTIGEVRLSQILAATAFVGGCLLLYRRYKNKNMTDSEGDFREVIDNFLRRIHLKKPRQIDQKNEERPQPKDQQVQDFVRQPQ